MTVFSWLSPSHLHFLDYVVSTFLAKHSKECCRRFAFQGEASVNLVKVTASIFIKLSTNDDSLVTTAEIAACFKMVSVCTEHVCDDVLRQCYFLLTFTWANNVDHHFHWWHNRKQGVPKPMSLGIKVTGAGEVRNNCFKVSFFCSLKEGVVDASVVIRQGHDLSPTATVNAVQFTCDCWTTSRCVTLEKCKYSRDLKSFHKIVSIVLAG